jgi:hypothetical protein
MVALYNLIGDGVVGNTTVGTSESTELAVHTLLLGPLYNSRLFVFV